MAEYSIQFRNADQSHRQLVGIEMIGNMFILYSDQWRSAAYSFEDLVSKEDQGDARTFHIFQGQNLRRDWEMTIMGKIPEHLELYLPAPKTPKISTIGMLAIAFLCLAIVHMAANAV